MSGDAFMTAEGTKRFAVAADNESETTPAADKFGL